MYLAICYRKGESGATFSICTLLPVACRCCTWPEISNHDRIGGTAACIAAARGWVLQNLQWYIPYDLYAVSIKFNAHPWTCTFGSLGHIEKLQNLRFRSALQAINTPCNGRLESVLRSRADVSLATCQQLRDRQAKCINVSAASMRIRARCT